MCDGANYEHKKYSRLFKAIGEHWGTDNDTTFLNFPILGGMFLRGFDDECGIDQGRKICRKAAK
ncbi:tail fiber protein [Bartonella schoenbuchensis]|uniref:35 kDa protein n=1 Tax=Bartonella schoenbuchensis (strain DSM 13525 / NCTC 13165 / R1) TaxID=687861 RepID=E6YXY3_BARSR